MLGRVKRWLLAALRCRRERAALLTRPARRGLEMVSGRRASHSTALRAGSTPLPRASNKGLGEGKFRKQDLNTRPAFTKVRWMRNKHLVHPLWRASFASQP
jgi:hypothetical protein